MRSSTATHTRCLQGKLLSQLSFQLMRTLASWLFQRFGKPKVYEGRRHEATGLGTLDYFLSPIAAATVLE